MSTFTDVLNSRVLDIKEKAATAARLAQQHKAKGHTAQARVYQRAAERLRKELEESIAPLGDLGAIDMQSPKTAFGFILGALGALVAVEYVTDRIQNKYAYRARKLLEREEER